MSAIHLLPLGGARAELAAALAGGLAAAFGTAVEERRWEVDLESFFDAERGQYNSTSILVHLKRHYAPAARADVRVLALLPFDLFIPILTYVFGEAEVGGSVAVVSYCRLAPERYGLPADDALLAERLLKEAVHELGHVASLIHCAEQSCVMHASSYVEDIDLKGPAFCSVCAAELEHRS
ncbi:MAG TPA: archaemetzincin family Zn-dependent metalloprotease [Bacteroidota bacterium]|nr:archaemetzincin family Zn-dependent metalloprotease [Bacteroidota bacterium]